MGIYDYLYNYLYNYSQRRYYISVFNPKYNLTSELLSNIGQVERLYGRLESLQLPQKLHLNLERDNFIKSSYLSNSIEGNPLSLPEVTNLLLDERVPVNRDEKEVCNYFGILKNLEEYIKKPLSLALILDIHRELMKGVSDDIAGKIRNKPIIVGRYTKENGQVMLKIKHNPPSHKKHEIEKRLKNLIYWFLENNDLPVTIKAGIFHHEFVYIHPFMDGNGRVCRILTAFLFLQAGYFINKYFILDDYYDVDRPSYSDSLHSADKGDKTKWLLYFSNGLKYSLLSALGRAKSIIASLSIDIRPSRKEKEILEIFKEQKEMTSTDLAQKLKVSRQQAHAFLASLVKKGFLKKKGITKNSFYCLKQYLK